MSHTNRAGIGRAHLDRDYFTRPAAAAQAARPCDHPGCNSDGVHRAPKDRKHLNDYYWFCLAHVQQYNRAWDYCAGLSEDQIEAEIRRDTTWQRPSWPLGKWGIMERRLREKVVRGKGFAFGSDADMNEDSGANRRSDPAFAETPEAQALAVLGLSPPVGFDTVKARYRELAKANHPDANGGDRDAEERLKVINHAYTVLKGWYGA